MTPTQLNYFNSMAPNQTLHISKVKDPVALIQAAKEYISTYGNMELNDEHTQVTKLNSIPPDNLIHVLIK